MRCTRVTAIGYATPMMASTSTPPTATASKAIGWKILRYGIHYMFSNDNRVVGNLTRRTRTGYALMQSRKLTVIGNRPSRIKITGS